MRRRDMLKHSALGLAGAFIAGCEPAALPVRPVKKPDALAHRFAAQPAMDGQGATLHRIFPSNALGYLDPFVLLDDFHVSKPAGFPRHPHRGFEAFTYMIDGAFHHQDNLGNDSVITSGGIQRFTSGRGAYHSEMPASDQVNTGLQLWVNLPRRLKTMDPEYEGTDAAAIPERKIDGMRTRTVVGEKSPAVLRTEVQYLDIAFERASRFEREIRDGITTLVYVLTGEVQVGDMRLAAREGARIDAGRLHVEGAAGSRFVYLAGRPHGEPILHRGPFVD